MAMSQDNLVSTKFRRIDDRSLSSPSRTLVALLVEDAPENQFLMSKILSGQDITVELACDGAEGVKKAMIGNYDFILMDMHMPVLDGYEATRFLRNMGYQKPIIALTADSLAEEHRRIMASGCDAHLTKPVDFGRLLQTIADFTRRPWN